MSKISFLVDNDVNGKRKPWLDFLRGLAMLLVIWGHLAPNDEIFFVIAGFLYMPLFFAITGYLFNDRNGKVFEFLKRLFFSIILPWILLSLVWLKPFVALFRKDFASIPRYFSEFFSGDNLWFMPCLIVAECIFFLVKRIPGRRWQYLTMGLLCIGGLVLGYFKIRLFAVADVALTAQGFFLLGYWFKNNEEKLRKTLDKPRVLIGMAVLYAALVAVCWFFLDRFSISVHRNSYGPFPISLPMIFISVLWMFLAVPKLKKLPAWIVFVGQNSLLFYIGHYWPRAVITLARKYLKFSLPDTFWGHLAAFIFVCVTMSVLALLFNRFLPFAVGKKREKKRKGFAG